MAKCFDLSEIIGLFRKDPDFHKMGMIVSHLGVVRGSSRSATGDVMAVEVAYDHAGVKKIVSDIEMLNGIVKVFVDFNEGRLRTGEDILVVAVGGDIRENVFPALESAVNRIKSEAVKKKEIFGDQETHEWE